MIEKPLILLSIFFNVVGMSGLSNKYDQAIAKLETGNNSKVVASVGIDSIGFPEILPSPATARLLFQQAKAQRQWLWLFV